jgi:hypothetical protein
MMELKNELYFNTKKFIAKFDILLKHNKCTNKHNLIKFIIRTIFDTSNCIYVFGSSATSKYSKLEPKDMDLIFENKNVKEEFIRTMKIIFKIYFVDITDNSFIPTGNELRDQNTQNYGFTISRYQLKYKNIILNFDFTIKEEINGYVTDFFENFVMVKGKLSLMHDTKYYEQVTKKLDLTYENMKKNLEEKKLTVFPLIIKDGKFESLFHVSQAIKMMRRIYLKRIQGYSIEHLDCDTTTTKPLEYNNCVITCDINCLNKILNKYLIIDCSNLIVEYIRPMLFTSYTKCHFCPKLLTNSNDELPHMRFMCSCGRPLREKYIIAKYKREKHMKFQPDDNETNVCIKFSYDRVYHSKCFLAIVSMLNYNKCGFCKKPLFNL